MSKQNSHSTSVLLADIIKDIVLALWSLLKTKKLNISLTDENKKRFSSAQAKFNEAVEKESFHTTDAFLLPCLLHFEIELKEKNLLVDKVPLDFQEMLFKDAKRVNGKRRIKNNEKSTLTTTNPAVRKVFVKIAYALSKEDKSLHEKEYSTAYFFFDVVDFIKENIDEIIQNEQQRIIDLFKNNKL